MKTMIANSRVTSPSTRLAVAAFATMGSIYFFSYFQRVGVPGTIFNELQSSFAATAAAVTALSSIYLYIYAGAQLIVGMLADRCLLYTSPSPRDRTRSRMPSSA